MSNNPLSSESYINKDFQSIYPELLDLVKKMSYKWDPTISNESDPGVILLKLNAIIADKNNYNIDKNVLECFPATVTQERNARNLYEQLGYNMSWYKAASTKVAFQFKKPEDEELSYKSVNIPMFTMITDDANEVVYTLTEQVSLLTDGTVATCNALQGTIETLKINNSTTITYANLDEYNRLYIPDYNIAENGIFISNVDEGENYSDWKMVDNVHTQEVFSKCYKLGVDVNTNSVYIEFSDEIGSLIGSGLNIKYIRTDGLDGNISANFLTKLYVDVHLTINDEKVTLNSDNIKLRNTSATHDGSNPETIEEAYTNYRKVVGTFDTLVTLRDYVNALLTSELVSNGFVCDRTNDIQSTVSIVTKENESNIVKNTVLVNSSTGEKELDAYSLRLYPLQQVSAVIDKASYNNTFKVAVSSDYGNNLKSYSPLVTYYDDMKMCNHDFIDLLENRIVFIKNKVNISAKILPYQSLTELQVREITDNINLALFENFNSTKISFGQEITWEDVYLTISKSDSRIKSVILNELEFIPYVVKYDSVSASFVESKLDNAITSVTGSALNNYDVLRYTNNEIYAKSVLAGTTNLIKHDNTFKYSVTQTYTDLIENIKNATTNVNIPFQITPESNYMDSYVMRENENIQFTRPSTIDVISYSSGTKYETNIATPVYSDTPYELKAGEYITFFWKEVDDMDAPYYYRKYTKDSTEFILMPKNTSIYDTNRPKTDGDNGYVNISEHWAQGSGKVSDGEKFKTISDNVSDVLTSAKEVLMQKINEVEIKSGTKCYWLLNNSDGSKYTLFNNNETEYTLATGESFLYTNKDMTQLHILGAGTKITRSLKGDVGVLTEWSVNVLESELDPTQEGLNAFSDNDWFVIPADINCTVTEQAFYSIGKDTKITLTATPNFPANGIWIFNNNGLFKLGGGGDTPLEKFDIMFEYNGETTVLPTITSERLKWSGKSVLSLSMSTTEPQILLENQSVEFKDIDGTSTTLKGTTTGVNYTPLYMLSNVPMYLDGGININTTLLTSSGEINYLAIYAYNYQVNNSNNSIYTALTDGAVSVDISNLSTDKEVDISCKLPAGKYIIPLMKSNNADVTISTQHGELLNSDNSTFKYAYIYVSAPNGLTNVVFNVHPNNAPVDSQAYIEIKSLIKVDGEINQTLLKSIQQLDPQQLYDYTYVVDSYDEIENPLDAYSFFRSNHIYNPFTICQLDNIDIKIQDRVR